MRNLFAFIWHHRSHLPTLGLFVGFFLDIFTIGRADGLFANAVMLLYLLIAGIGLLAFNYARERGRHTNRYAIWILTIVQFTFGNMASGLFAIYQGSGTFFGSWLFLLGLLGLLIGNEFIKSRYAQLRFTIGVYYALALSYFVIGVPVVMRSIGVREFLFAGAASVAFIILFLLLVALVARGTLRHERRALVLIVVMILGSFNVLYFLHLIPPVPLAVSQLGIYHGLARDVAGGGYRATYEPDAWYAFWKSPGAIFRFGEGDRAYCFAAVYAPARLSTNVVQKWEYLDPSVGEWQEEEAEQFEIIGGRPGGYRLYSWKTILLPGSWRCTIETPDGAIIGRKTFTAVQAEGPLQLETVSL